MITFSEFLLISEAKRPISQGARSQIADVAGDLGSRRYSQSSGSYRITRNPSKIRKQRAMGELP